MDARVLVYDRRGLMLDEVTGDISREWVTNGVGKAEISMARNDSRLRPELFANGNRVLIEAENVEPWAGVVYVDQEWNDTTVKLVAHGPEIYWLHRVVKKPPPLDLTAVEMMRWLIGEGNRIESTPITEIGTMKPRSNEVIIEDTISPGMMIYDAIQTVADTMYSNWYLEPVLDGGEVRWRFHFIGQKFSEGLAMWDGVNVVVDPSQAMSMSGELWTGIYVKATLASGDAGEIYLASAPASNKYGLWEGSLSLEFADVAQAYAVAASIIRRHAVPKARFSLKAFPRINPELTRTIKIGSVHPFVTPHYGFLGDDVQGGVKGTKTLARVVGMRYTQTDGVLEVIVDDTASEKIFDDWLNEWVAGKT